MAEFIADFVAGDILDWKWDSKAKTGKSITLATDGSLRIYKNNSTTERSSSSGITFTEDFDTIVGNHHVRIDLSDNTDVGFYAVDNTYFIVLVGAIIDGEDPVNHTIAWFTIEKKIHRANVIQWNGTNVITPDTAGAPKVTVKDGTGQGEILLTSGAVDQVTLVATATQVTNGVGLADDAISAAKFDESTAFPLKSNDAGSTLVARTGADADTLKTLSDQIDLLLTATKFLRYLQVTLRSDIGIGTDNAAELAEINANGGSGAGDYSNSTHSQEGVADNAQAAAAAALTAYDPPTRAEATSDKSEITSAISALNNLSAAQVNAEVDQALLDYDGPTNAEMVARTLPTASYGTAANQTTIINLLDTEVADVLAAVEVTIPAAIGALNDISAADVWAAATRTLTAATNITSTGGTTVPNTGDPYAIVNSGTFGNSALKTLIDALTGVIVVKVDTMLELDGAVYRLTTNALEQAPAGGGGSAPTVEEIDIQLSLTHGAGSWEPGGLGSGARTVTVTVEDSTGVLVLEGAIVRLTKGAETYIGTTDLAGQVVFNVDDGTWVVAITLAGYSFAGASLVVNGVETPTYMMTEVVITPSVADQTTGYFTVYDEDGIPEVGVPITATVKEVPEGHTGSVFDGAEVTVVSDANGLVEFPNLFKGVTYFFKRGTGRSVTVIIPAGTGGTYELPSIIGKEAV